MNVFDHIVALLAEDSEESCRQATYTYPPCQTKKCPGRLRTTSQMRFGQCVTCMPAGPVDWAKLEKEGLI